MLQHSLASRGPLQTDRIVSAQILEILNNLALFFGGPRCFYILNVSATMEGLVREMQDHETGVPVRSQKLFLTSIPSAFMGER
uniref:Uncharacterized protein n=1 Tax=Timema monikensis TaxID=170555 RepID=A0A7R9EB16_9NEOP|nr:unnamed protein product [Timema monikensis]